MMKNITLILLLFVSTFSYATASMTCSEAVVTLMNSGQNDPVTQGQATGITVCLPGCDYLEDMEYGAGLSIDIHLPIDEIQTLEYDLNDLVAGTTDCFFIKFEAKFCGIHKVDSPKLSDSFGNTVTPTTEYSNGYVYYVDGPSFNNDFQVTAYESGFYATSQDYGNPHVWTINGIVTNCSTANCSFDGMPGNTYTVCHQNSANSACDNEQVCETVETLCPVETPSIDQIDLHNTCGENIFVKTPEFAGILHNIRTREVGSSDSDWEDSGFSFETNRLNPCTFEECTLIEIQVQTLCNGEESEWSESLEFTTRPYRPAVSSFASQTTASTATIAISNYDGDWMYFKYWKAGQWPLQVSYRLATGNLVNGYYLVTIDDLDPNSTYRFHVKRRCGGSSDLYSCYTNTPQYFTTSSNMNDGTSSRQGIEEELIIENHIPKIACSPNPSNGRFTLSGDLVKVGNQMTIHNLTGKKVAEKLINDDVNMEFNLGLEAGTYFLTIIDQATGKMTSERIVVQNL